MKRLGHSANHTSPFSGTNSALIRYYNTYFSTQRHLKINSLAQLNDNPKINHFSF